MANKQGEFPIFSERQLKKAWSKYPLADANNQAAVLVPLVEFQNAANDNDIHLVFTKRSSNLRSHSSEISFPGGGREPQDENVIATALRETQEELLPSPLATMDWAVVGTCTPIPSLHGKAVTAVLGVYRPLLQCSAINEVFPGDSQEVEKVFSVSISALLEGETMQSKSSRMGAGIGAPAYQTEGEDVIWGLTAFLLRPLLHDVLKPTFLSKKE
eukprot:CAMPEP_0194214588 /NCGR_PEP_ID=MMETSP0156-20130528/15863_1 /TAXON_ID=33649 /ORGANISM="Thalassionema nitzschioides, Strain L26-B" /LENGTH=214 /DNA_ID=CAMNT_0038942879 /DNA_START=217 /DNA_END=861 /DNA_ORIENTATION=-